jgi:hypothetical protein
MDKLDNHLNPHMKEALYPLILVAMKLARKKLNRYYSLTDHSEIYQIVMSEFSATMSTTFTDNRDSTPPWT